MLGNDCNFQVSDLETVKREDNDVILSSRPPKSLPPFAGGI